MASNSIHSLRSTATAIALILPPSQSTNVNAIRSVHDRAFHRWPPHINILYPSVEPEHLQTALPLIREALCVASLPPTSITLDRIGTFSHRKNATVLLQPSKESETAIAGLRSRMVKALGLSEHEGTRDGAFRPHLTLGQASLSGTLVEKLVETCKPLTGVNWDASDLAVLRRNSSGEMEIIDHISLYKQSDSSSNQGEISNETFDSNSVWSQCFRYSPDHGWCQYQTEAADSLSERKSISILSYNLLADTFGCSFIDRLPLIIEALENATRHQLDEFLCLQEISHGMLSQLLDHPFVQQRYPFCSHTNSSVLANYLNLVILSTAPFESTFHHFEERHKSALVMRPYSSPFEIANVHLSAALKDNMVAAKQRQIASLTKFLNDNAKHSGRLPIIAGDFNLATSPETIQSALDKGDISFATSIAVRGLVDPDIWSDSFVVSSETGEAALDDERGATFDVQMNPLAAESNAPSDQKPQRYDRILFRRSDALDVDHFCIFGRPNQDGRCGSDHFGIGAVLHVGHGGRDAASTLIPMQVSNIQPDLAEANLEPLLESFLPTEQDRDLRAQAISRLKRLLASNARMSDIAVIPLGSYALGTYFADSDVDVLVIGSLTPTAFFNIASGRLKTFVEGFHGLHYINSLVPVIEVEVLGIKFDVQYCQAPQLLPTQLSGSTTLDALLFDEQLISTLPPAALRPLNTYRDTAYLLRTITCIEAFRTAHRYLSLYLRRRGLYSAKFGYLGGVHLSLMLNHVIKRLDSKVITSITPATLIRTFVQHYSNFAWDSAFVVDPSHPHLDYRRTSREPVVILALHSPTARPNVASSCSRLSAHTLTKEFKLASQKLQEGDWEWMLRSPRNTLQDFTANFGAFVLITIDMWDLPKFGENGQRDFFGNVESRTPALMVNLSRIEGLQSQAWPFRLGSVQDDIEPGKQLKAYYLIGVTAPADVDADKRKLLEGKLSQVVQGHEAMIHQSQLYNEKHVLMQIELLSRRKIVALKLGIE